MDMIIKCNPCWASAKYTVHNYMAIIIPADAPLTSSPGASLGMILTQI